MTAEEALWTEGTSGVRDVRRRTTTNFGGVFCQLKPDVCQGKAAMIVVRAVADVNARSRGIHRDAAGRPADGNGRGNGIRRGVDHGDGAVLAADGIDTRSVIADRDALHVVGC